MTDSVQWFEVAGGGASLAGIRTPKNSELAATDNMFPPRVIERFVATAGLLTVLTRYIHHWLGALDHAAETYFKLKNSGLLDMLTGG